MLPDPAVAAISTGIEREPEPFYRLRDTSFHHDHAHARWTICARSPLFAGGVCCVIAHVCRAPAPARAQSGQRRIQRARASPAGCASAGREGARPGPAAAARSRSSCRRASRSPPPRMRPPSSRACRMRGSGRIRRPTSTTRCRRKPGPWLILSSGGADGAFGAGLLNGLSAAGKRPDYAVVTGVSTGALMAPFVFAGPRYDDALRDAYTQDHLRRIFSRSALDRRKLRRYLAAQGSDRQGGHAGSARRYRRRISRAAGACSSSPPISTPNAPWSGTWAPSPPMAASEAALNLFRTVLLASGSIPGAFPPVLIDVEATASALPKCTSTAASADSSSSRRPH